MEQHPHTQAKPGTPLGVRVLQKGVVCGGGGDAAAGIPFSPNPAWLHGKVASTTSQKHTHTVLRQPCKCLDKQGSATVPKGQDSSGGGVHAVYGIHSGLEPYLIPHHHRP